MALRDVVARRAPLLRFLGIAALLCVAPAAGAQPQPVRWSLDLEGGRFWPAIPRVVVDGDDDDENALADREQASAIPADDLVQLRFFPARPEGELTLRAEGGVRLVQDGRPVEGALHVAPGQALPSLQGTVASSERGQGRLVVEAPAGRLRIPVTVVELSFLDAQNRPVEPADHALALSRHVTHDRTLPRTLTPDETSPDPENFRVLLRDASLAKQAATLSLLSDDPSTGAVHHVLRHVPAVAQASGETLRSPFLRLVGDRTDLSAPEVGNQLLAVGLRERVRVRYRAGPNVLSQDIPVGFAEGRGGDRAALGGRLRLRALRLTPGGVPVIGRSDLEAIGLLREQVQVANEIWLQCGIDFGRPEEADAAVVDPPPAALLAFGDGDGLPAAGGGEIRFVAGDRRIGPVRTRAGHSPAQTALEVHHALRTAGFSATVTVNPRTEYGAGRSADLVVRDRHGRPVALSPWPDAPPGTDAMQSVQIGSVDLSDGVQQFDNMNASAGTLEERTLLKLLGDDDPSTIDLFVINRFHSPERQGEAFIEGDGGAIVNMLILDRNGVRFQRQAWVQAHELGHVLLDAPYHPDNIGPDRPWLLMDADARQGRVTGPKRLTDDECARARRRSGPGASPALLVPHPRR